MVHGGVGAGEMRARQCPAGSGAGNLDCMDEETYQNVRNSQSYTRLNNPAMVAKGRAVTWEKEDEQMSGGWKSGYGASNKSSAGVRCFDG